VLVRANLVQVAGEQVGERRLIHAVVLAGVEPDLERRGGSLGEVGNTEPCAQQPEGGLNDSLARSSQPVPRQPSVPEREVLSGDHNVHGGPAGSGVTGS